MRADLITPSTRLQKATKRMQERWQDTAAVWDDAVSQQFQRRHLDRVTPAIQLAVSAIHELKTILDQAEKETRDEE